jgi:hypothetical protein
MNACKLTSYEFFLIINFHYSEKYIYRDVLYLSHKSITVKPYTTNLI